MHRNIHGQKGDHALLACTWKWRVRNPKPQLRKDFSSLSQPDVLHDFEEAVELKLDELAYDGEWDTATAMYDKMCEAIAHAVETVLPLVHYHDTIERHRHKYNIGTTCQQTIQS